MAAADDALVDYLRKWEGRLAYLQRTYPQRWRVPGLSAEEVRDALTLRLLETLREDPERGDERALGVARRHLGALRKSFRLAATPVDFNDAPVAERALTQEERCLELEATGRRAVAQERAEGALNRPQRRWLTAMKMAAARGEFFAASDDLNLSAASRLLGKNRSSAQRAYRELQRRFEDELRRP